jgi:hypothetical protein
MIQAKLQEIYVLKKKVEKQEDNTLRDVKIFPLSTNLLIYSVLTVLFLRIHRIQPGFFSKKLLEAQETGKKIRKKWI